jgi:hypothetical protein
MTINIQNRVQTSQPRNVCQLYPGQVPKYGNVTNDRIRFLHSLFQDPKLTTVRGHERVLQTKNINTNNMDTAISEIPHKQAIAWCTAVNPEKRKNMHANLTETNWQAHRSGSHGQSTPEVLGPATTRRSRHVVELLVLDWNMTLMSTRCCDP